MSKLKRSHSGTGLEPIEKVLENLFQTGKFAKSSQVAQLWGQWKEIVGDDVARHCIPEKIERKKLYIKVDNPVWHQQLDLLKDEIKARIDARFGNINIDKIIFRSTVPGA
ncbi:MAG: hypothetical protein Kow0099_14730 [Candidatus Abyssubacteria bacterium]